MLQSSISGDGHFRVTEAQWRNEPNHCGIDVDVIRWHARVSGDLDARGFVADVRDLHAYWRQVYVDGAAALPSCEEMASRAVAHFCALAPTARAVTVEVQASELGFAVAEWTRDGGPAETVAPVYLPPWI